MDARRQPGGSRPGVKTGLIPDHHLFGLRVAIGYLCQEAVAQLQAARGQEPELRPALKDFQRAIDVFPFIALLLRDHHPLSPQRPAAAALRVQPKTTLIGHPNLDRSILG